MDESARGAGRPRARGAAARIPISARRVSQIDVTDARDAVVMLKDDTALLRVGDEQFAERLQSYLDLAPALRERIAGHRLRRPAVRRARVRQAAGQAAVGRTGR